MKAATRRAFLALSLLAALPRCASDPVDPTAVFVRLTVEGTLRATVRRVVVRVFDADQAMGRHVGMPAVFDVPPADGGVPPADYTFVVAKQRGSSLRQVRIEADGYDENTRTPEALMPGSGLVQDRVIVAYVTNQVVEVSLQLRDACRLVAGRMPCPPTERCDARRVCVDAIVRNPPRHMY